MTDVPVLVVGIGGAGCGVLSAVQELTEDQGDEGNYRLLAVDSNTRDLAERAPAAASTYRLDVDPTAYERDRDRVPYLQNEPDLVSDAGTARRRALGRYLVASDGDPAGLADTLGGLLVDLTASTPDGTPVQVWLVSSLGGGTGSGAVPLVAAMVHQHCRREDVPIELYGVGSLPRLDELARTIEQPEGEPAHYANAYTALRELRTLMDLDGGTDYPLSLGIDDEPASVRTEALTLPENPFDGYWLLGTEQSARYDADHVARINGHVARLIRYLAGTEQRDWFTDGTLYSLTGGALELPDDRIAAYTDISERLADLDQELADLRGRREAVKSASETLQSVLQFDGETASAAFDGEFTAEEFTAVTPLAEALSTACIDLAATYSAPDGGEESIVRELDRQVQDVVERHGDTLPRDIDADPVVRYLAATLLLQRTRHHLATHPLPGYIEQLRSRWLAEPGQDERADVDVEDSPVADRSADGQFREVLEELQARRERLSEKVERSAIPAIFSTHGQRRSDLEADIERAERFLDEYDRLQTLESALVEDRQRARRTLRTDRRALEDRAEELRNEWEQTQQRWSQLSRRHDELRSAITEPAWEDGRFSLPLNGIDDGELPEETDLSGAISNGVLGRDDLGDGFEELLQGLREPVEDLADSQFGTTEGRLGILAAASTHELLSELLLEGGDEGESVRRELYYQFEKVDDIVHWDRPNVVHCLACFSPVSLERTSEFGTVHEYYTDPDDDVEAVLGSIADAELDRRFAYPELVDVPD